MKKLVLIFVFGLGCLFVSAQKVDTVKRWVDGVQIRSTDDVLENASQIKRLSKFVSLLNYSGISDSIKNEGPVTIFAPDNNAIGKLHDAVYDSLSKPANKWQLANLLKCYIIKGRFTSKEILTLVRKNNGQAFLTMLSGSTLIATIDANHNIVLTDMNGEQSIISTFDIQAKNGLLDIITSPLFPLKHPG